jgi:hypothetical protein
MTSNRFEHSWPALSCSFNLLRNRYWLKARTCDHVTSHRAHDEFKIGERAISFQLILEQTPRLAARLQDWMLSGDCLVENRGGKLGFADFSQRILIQATMRWE